MLINIYQRGETKINEKEQCMVYAHTGTGDPVLFLAIRCFGYCFQVSFPEHIPLTPMWDFSR